MVVAIEIVVVTMAVKMAVMVKVVLVVMAVEVAIVRWWW